MPADLIRVLAISGSLRRSSSNGALVAAAARLAPAGMEVSTFESLAEIPPFNPDLEEEGAPEAVSSFRRLLTKSDALLISSPEYAHGVPGVLKNALDWIVGSGEVVGKAVALVNASPRSTYAWNSLLETLTVMSACVIREASVPIPLQGRGLDAEGIIGDTKLSAAVTSALDALAAAVRASRDA